MIMKLCMKHYEHKRYIVYMNDDPELTMAYFTAISNYAFIHSTPRYQMSVYRMIGPMVTLFLFRKRIKSSSVFNTFLAHLSR